MAYGEGAYGEGVYGGVRSAYASAVLSDSPWGFWELAEDVTAPVNSTGSDTTAWSAAAGAEFGLPPIPTGSTGTAARSTGAGIAVRSGIPASLTGDNVTGECWFTMPSGGAKGSLFKFGSSGGDGWAVGLGGTQFDNVGSTLILLAENVAWQPTSVTVSAGKHHLFVTRGAGRAITVILDGVSVWTGTLSAPNTPVGMTVGGHINGANVFYLSDTVPMDEVAFYASALSSARATAHFNGGAGSDSAVTADSPVIRLRLDESALTSTFSDGSGNARALLPAGARPTRVTGPTASLYGQQFPSAAASLETSASYSQPTTVTYEFWMKYSAAPTADTGLAVFGGSGAYGNTSGVILRTTGKVQFALYKSGGLSIETPTALSTDAWHHVVCSVGADGAKIRVDKTTAASSATTSVGSLATGKLYIRAAGPNSATGTGGVTIAAPAVWYGSQLSDARTDAHYDAAAGPASVTGPLSASLPALSANLSGGIEFTGTIAATLPTLGANLAGTSLPPGVAGTLSAVLPALSADLAGTSTEPSYSGTLDALLPALSADLAGQSFQPGLEGYIEALLPALSAAFSGDVLGRNGLGLALDSSAVLTVEAPLEPEPTVPPDTPPTVLHVIAPTVPVPTLVNGRPQ